MSFGLSTGVLKNIFEGDDVKEPILQVVTIKPIASGSKERYRLMVSDGQWSTVSVMMATQLNETVQSGSVNPRCVIRIDNFMLNNLQDTKKVFIILNLTVLASGDTVGIVIGNPTSYESAVQNDGGNGHVIQGRAPLAQLNTMQQPSMMTMEKGSPSQPISSLTPYQNKWTICARVTNKGNIRTWSNARGDGKLFSMDLLDESGEIRATAFNDQCDKFHPMIEVDKVYYISQAQLKTANKQYSTLKNDYEMTFNSATQIISCHENTSIPAMQFEFVSIDQLEKAERNDIVDIIGICKSADDVTNLQTKAGKEIKKRDLQLVDSTASEVRLTLWGSQAEDFQAASNPVVAIKGVKVSEFNGRSLSALSSSSLQINPDIREAHKLRAWFDNVGSSVATTNLSGGRSTFGATVFKTIGEARLENLGAGDQPDYYVTKGYVTLVRQENVLYTACPAENCNKKVVDMTNGVYRCEKCSQEYDSFNWRLMAQICIADGTDNLWLTVFNDQAETLLGQSAKIIGEMRENDQDGYSAIFQEANFKEFTFKLRVKMDTYNDESRLRTTAVNVAPLDLVEHNKRLIDTIKKMSQ